MQTLHGSINNIFKNAANCSFKSHALTKFKLAPKLGWGSNTDLEYIEKSFFRPTPIHLIIYMLLVK